MTAGEKPWYRHFWLWFMLAPLIATVVASFATLIIAGSTPSLVVDDFGQIEKTVEQEQAQDRRAAALGLGAQLQFDPGRADGGRAVAVTLSGAAPQAVRLTLIHPTRGDSDHSALLERVGSVYGGVIVRPDTRLYVLITDPAGDWRLTGEIGPGQQAVELRAAAGR